MFIINPLLLEPQPLRLLPFDSLLQFPRLARFPLLRAEHSVLLPPTADAGLFPRTALRSTGGCSVRVASDVPLPPGTRVTVSAAQI